MKRKASSVSAAHVSSPNLSLWQVTPTRHNQIHARELDLVDRALLRWERTNLIGGNHRILALLFPSRTLDCNLSTATTTHARVCTIDARSISLSALTNDFTIATLMCLSRKFDVPDTNCTICSSGAKDRRLDAEREGPDSTSAMAAAALDHCAFSNVPKDYTSASIS